jgi:hypothetical protein
MDSDTMPAGREMDALVAERVMGLAWDESRCRVCGWPLATDVMQSSAGCYPGNCSLRPRPARNADEPAHYSTDIAAAWLVVKRMCSFIGVDDDLWGRFVDEMNTAHDYAISDFLSHASPLIICRCALAAFRTAT